MSTTDKPADDDVCVRPAERNKHVTPANLSSNAAWSANESIDHVTNERVKKASC